MRSHRLDVYLGSPRGFCAGVVRAVEIVERALQRHGPPVYVKHQIVHNPHVVADLEARGAVTVDDLDDVPEGSAVVFSAHGSASADFERARDRSLRAIDATCPLVTRVHDEAKKYTREGRRVILVGHRGHQEVVGTMGQAPMSLVDERKEPEVPDWGHDAKVAVLTQTTLSPRDTAHALSAISTRYPDAIVRNNICYATTNRQRAATAVATCTELVLVIGAENSSNCARLREVAEAVGTPAKRINGPEELDMTWLEGIRRVGVTSGASTPEIAVQAVVRALNPDRVMEIGGPEERITFTLPPDLLDPVPLT